MAFYVSQSDQLMILTYSFIIGLFFGVLYDIFRISRVLVFGNGIGKMNAGDNRIEGIIRGIIPERNEQTKILLSKLGHIKEKTVTVLIFFEDILFFIISSLFFTVFLFQLNFGQLRLYIYLGAAAGFTAYYFTVAKLSAAISGMAVSLIRLALFFTFYKIAKPILIIIAKAISVPVNRLKLKRIRYADKKESERLLLSAQRGFFAFEKSALARSGQDDLKLKERRVGNERRKKARNKKIKPSG
ncbi:MAG: spore cortex biosynthesis protein YabQ [Clostridia bacterium]|nr:spore cortex biosynthesis protein YabQ [Clostridia bacterium]